MLCVISSVLITNWLTHYPACLIVSIDCSIPPPSFPPVHQFSNVAGDAVGIAIVSFTISISMAKLFAKKHNYPLDPNQVVNTVYQYHWRRHKSSFCLSQCPSVKCDVITLSEPTAEDNVFWLYTVVRCPIFTRIEVLNSGTTAVY